MKKLIVATTLSAGLALTACGGTETPAEETPAAIAEDDNDAAAPVAEPHDENEPHDESVPHDH